MRNLQLISGQRPTPTLLLYLLLLVTARYTSAQPSNNNNSPSNPYLGSGNFNPSTAIIIVVLVSAFFFLGFFSIYLRNCAGGRLHAPGSTRAVTAAAGRSRRQRGINPEILATFPTFAFSEVRAHKIGKSDLECAVCLCEFEGDEELRLLPGCSHVFHADCIDAWLAAHVTCPVCRRNLEEAEGAKADPADATEAPPPPPSQESAPAPPVASQQVTIQIENEGGDEEREAEIENLEKFINMKRSRSRAARPAKFPRSHSTGHSLVLPGEDLERYTLRLPASVRRQLLKGGTTSSAAFPREGSSRRGEGSTGRGARSIRLGSSRSERWGSFLVRTLSVKNWGRRGDGDGSSRGGGVSRRGESIRGEGSVAKGKGKNYRRGDSVKFEAPTSSVV